MAAVSVRDKGFRCWRSNGKVVLRQFQKDLVREIRGRFEKQDVVSAEIYCAGGKTILGGAVGVPFLQAGKTILFISPKRDAFSHFENELNRVFYPYGKPLPGIPPDAVSACYDPSDFAFPFTEQVHIVTPYDLVAPRAGENERKAIESALKNAGLVILDEVHRMPEDKEGDTVIIGKVEPIVRELAIANGAKVLTLTGTHFRADGKSPFGVDEPDVVRTCQDLILEGCLPNLYGFPVALEAEGLKSVRERPNFLSLKYTKEGRRRNLEQVVDIIMQTVEIEAASCPAGMTPCGHAIFVGSQDDARDICRMLNERMGWEAFVPYVSDEVANGDRLDVQARLCDGRLRGYATVMMGAESINVPRLKYAHLVARITSPNKLMQAMGRVMRLPSADDAELLAVKDKAVVVDYQVRKKKILKLAMGIRDIASLGSSRKDGPLFGGPVFESPGAAPLPSNHGLTLGEYEEWLFQTGERMTTVQKKEALLALPPGSPKPKDNTPLGRGLRRYTSPGNYSYDAEFDLQIREKQPQWWYGCSWRKKEALLALSPGSPRPKGNTPLGRALHNYTQPSSKSYDAEFDLQIRKKQPQWFRDFIPMTQRKAALLALPPGSPKPKDNTPLGRALRKYTHPESPFYDSELHVRLYKKQPQWRSACEKKAALLALPPGSPKPKWNTPLGRALQTYTKPSSSSYDSKLRAALEEKQPQWKPCFRKKVLLALPPGSPKPKRNTPLGDALASYTEPSSLSYDVVFHAQVKKKHRRWKFRATVHSYCEERKKELMELLETPGSPKPKGNTPLGRVLAHCTNPAAASYDAALDARAKEKWGDASFEKRLSEKRKKEALLALPLGSPKPKDNTPLGKALRRYVQPSSSSYDAVFHAQVRERHPCWADTAIKKKEALLALPPGSPRPKWNTPLGRALSRYTIPSSKSYDAVFHAQVKKRHPQWS